MSTQFGDLSLVKIKDDGQLTLDQNLPKVLNRLTNLQVSHCESFVVSFSDKDSDVIVWTKHMDKFEKTTILPHPCPVTCMDVNSKMAKAVIASGQHDGGIFKPLNFENSNFFKPLHFEIVFTKKIVPP